MSNGIAPPGLPCGDATADEDLEAYDRLPEWLRQVLRESPHDIDAVDVLAAYRRGFSEVFLRSVIDEFIRESIECHWAEMELVEL